MGADVYWNESTKYSGYNDNNTSSQPKNLPQGAPKEKPMTYDEALELKLEFGEYLGQTMREVWKKDAAYIKALTESTETPLKVLTAISIISVEIAKAKARNASARRNTFRK